jgi:hypothetical protein
MKKIIIFCSVLFLAGCGDCGSCTTSIDKDAYTKVFETCIQAPNGQPHGCRVAALAVATTKVCRKQ